MIILYILLFVVFLSSLIIFHELGHLLTAKMFNVYCFEYSIGFGPKIFSFKRKNGETRFSLRAIPFGGYVSMYGEKDTLPEGFEGEIDPSRSLLAIKKWKKIIIMAAGVIMNFLLAIAMFFVYEIAFPTYTARYGHVTIKEDSIAYQNGLRNEDFVYALTSTVVVDSNTSISYVFYDNEALLTYEDDTQESVYLGFVYSDLTLKNTTLRDHACVFRSKEYNNINITDYTEYSVSEILDPTLTDETVNIKTTGFVQDIFVNTDVKKLFYVISENFGETEEDKLLYVTYVYDTDEYVELTNVAIGDQVTIIGNISKVTNTVTNEEYKAVAIKDKNVRFFRPYYKDGNLLNKDNLEQDESLKSISFKNYVVDLNNLSGKGSSFVAFDNIALSLNGNTYRLDENIGISMQLDTKMNNFGEAFVNTFKDFGNGASLIFRTLGSLFTDGTAWQQIGGILAVGVTTTRILQENGFSLFLFYWALISVNLGIVNLLPFPGLDGWQILVTVIEGITRKEIPPKVKNWVSVIGIIILFALMVLILVKDIIGLF